MAVCHYIHNSLICKTPIYRFSIYWCFLLLWERQLKTNQNAKINHFLLHYICQLQMKLNRTSDFVHESDM